jgi:tol-pal system protein YbgF
MFIRQRLIVLTLGILLGGCQLMQPPGEDPVLTKLNELERRMDAIERVVRNQSLANMTQQVAALERQGDEIRGSIEELAHNSSTTADRQRQLYMDLDARIQDIETALQARAAPSVLEGGTLSPGELPLPSGSDRDNYQAAFELLKEQRYEPAALAFEQFLVSFPDSELADNAQYWLAESHYVTQKFERALNEFEVVIGKFPRSRKVPDALLKMGYCNYELQQWDAAKTSLQRVQADYPETTAARLAAQRLQRMQEEGV